MDFTNKKVLVTGGTRGIGKAIALAFAKKGAMVAVLFRSDQVSADTVLAELQGSGHLAIKADVADPDQVKKAVFDVIQHLGSLDIVVNNAGIGNYHPLPTTTRCQLPTTKIGSRPGGKLSIPTSWALPTSVSAPQST